MKRHPALEQLSRDHHHALVVAQALKRADKASGPTARELFLAYWETDGREHFRREEETLLPGCADFLDPDHPLIAKVLTDDVRIRRLADRLGATENPGPTVLHELGERLEDHVRREERELFPLIEASLPEPELRQLVSALNR